MIDIDKIDGILVLNGQISILGNIYEEDEDGNTIMDSVDLPETENLEHSDKFKIVVEYLKRLEMYIHDEKILQEEFDCKPLEEQEQIIKDSILDVDESEGFIPGGTWDYPGSPYLPEEYDIY